MKKILPFLLCICLLLTSVLFCACDNDTNFWETTYNNVCSLIEDENYAFVFDQTKMQRNQTLKNAIADNSNYQTLQTIYDFCFYQATDFLKTYYQGLQIKPINMTDKNKKSIKAAFENFDKELENFSDALSDFASANANFDAAITSENLVTSAVYLQKLKDFKGEYYKLISQTITLCNSFENLYSVGYVNTESENQRQTDNIKYINDSLRIEILQLYVKVELDCFDGTSSKICSPDLKMQICTLYENSQKQVNANADFESWLEKQSLFLNDFENANTSIQNFDIKSFVDQCNNQTDAYYQKHNQTFNTYLEVYANFAQNILPYFVEQTSNLFD